MKTKYHRILWSICLLCAAAALLLYAFDIDSGFFELPLYKLFIVLILVSHIISRAAFKNSLRERLQNFFPFSVLLVLLEDTLAKWVGIADGNLFRDIAILAAGIVIDIAIAVLIPKKITRLNHTTNRFSSATHYIDVNTTKSSWISNKMGETTVFYQNTESADSETVLELNIDNRMGDVTVHVPINWIIDNQIISKLGDISIRQNQGVGTKLILKGDNKFGNISIVSP